MIFVSPVEIGIDEFMYVYNYVKKSIFSFSESDVQFILILFFINQIIHNDIVIFNNINFVFLILNL